ncbi:MAG: hypothetical protein H5T69_05670, partial [Chloroflexi bacterium]|nr:hypothetical protein [Chloroflexota bacterium]
GRWKEGAQARDVTLNLSPDAPRPDNPDFEIVWEPESLWVARWKDKLSGKYKYIWLGETAPLRQEREALKFDKAVHLDEHIHTIRERIYRDLSSQDAQVRMIATACYLIDALCLRVGDEKEPDEADTVGATTLRPEHVTIHGDTSVEFRFLGKDSVEWHKHIELPELVVARLRELIANARPSSNDNGDSPSRGLPQLFPDITSRDVNTYLSGILPGLTAKVFRTHHATQAVTKSLEESGVKAHDPEYAKWEAANLANLEAAILCNHTKQYKGDWQRTKARYAERREKAEERIKRYRLQEAEYLQQRKILEEEAKQKAQEAATPEERRKVRVRYRKRIARAQSRLEAARERRRRAENALGKIKAQFAIAREKRQWNLGTSLKSYIDPRVYYRWGQKVDYDVLEAYYPATLRRKFAWVRMLDGEAEGQTEDRGIEVRACMPADLDAVVRFFARVLGDHPEARLPLDPQAIEARYLPSLEEDWKETFVALEDGEITGFIALGPVWTRGEASLLDVFGVLPPGPRSGAVATLLANFATRRLHDYQLHHPQENFRLCAQDDGWFELAPDLVEKLELDSDQEEEAQER